MLIDGVFNASVLVVDVRTKVLFFTTTHENKGNFHRIWTGKCQKTEKTHFCGYSMTADDRTLDFCGVIFKGILS